MSEAERKSSVQVAIERLVASGHVVKPVDFPPGLYNVNGHELTTNQVISAAAFTHSQA